MEYIYACHGIKEKYIQIITRTVQSHQQAAERGEIFSKLAIIDDSEYIFTYHISLLNMGNKIL